MAMIERCPSGALTYRFETDGPNIEPDLPEQTAVTTEIPCAGLIAGLFWVSGSIPIECSDMQLIETRNRVTLCNCWYSCNNPLRGGMHLEPEPLGGGRFQVDFNLAYHPYCAYSEHWSCPMTQQRTA